MFQKKNDIIQPREDKKLLEQIMKDNPLFKKFNEKKNSKYIDLKPNDNKEREIIY